MVEAAATMAISEGPVYAAISYCATAKVTPAARIGGQISIIARKPAKAQMSQKGTMTVEGHKDRGGGAREREQIDAGDAVQGDERNPHRAECHGSSVGEQREARGLQRLESETDKDGGADSDGSAESGGSLKERAEREGDEQKLQAAIGRDAGEALLQSDEGSGLDGEVVEIDDGKNDPADGKRP